MFVVLSVAFFNFKRCLKQLIVLKYTLIQIRIQEEPKL